MATIDELRSWIESCDIQISRLNSVYKELGRIKSSFQGARNGTEDIFKGKGTWRGETHTGFCNSGSELDRVLGEYYKRLDAAQDAVNKKIAQLKAKKWEFIPMLNDLVAQLQDKKSDIENALN